MSDKNPLPTIQFYARLKPPVTKREPDEQNIPLAIHYVGISMEPLPYKDVQRLAHAAYYGIYCDVTLELTHTYENPMNFAAKLKGPKAGAWEQTESGELRPRQSLEFVIDDAELTGEQLNDIAETAFPKKGPRSSVTILPREEQISMDTAASADDGKRDMRIRISGDDASRIVLGNNAFHQIVDTETGEIGGE